ncbi:MAG TPA: C-type lectin domain-containing protein [Polyangia bacterium]|nr:C-type lectin domain-containing protein [Polyangia bacterium]
MLSRARVALAALTFGPIAAWALSSVPGCAVNQSGLSLGGGGGASAGAGGSKGGASGTAGAGGGRAGTSGAAGAVGTTGTAGTLGIVGAAGTFGSTGGTGATGNAGTSGGAGAIGGSDATGGGAAGTDGQAGTTGGGGGPMVGMGGAGGRTHGGGGNSGHTPDCSSFPMGSSVTLSSDGLLHCYWTHADPASWVDSESGCEGEGGTLATVLSAQENTFLVQLGTQDQLFQGAAVWLGANDGKASADMSGPGTYSWVTGEPWDYTNWHEGQPDGSCSGCNIAYTCFCDHWLAFTVDGTWYDRSESVPRPYICEATAR